MLFSNSCPNAGDLFPGVLFLAAMISYTIPMFRPQFEISPGLLNLIAEISGVRELILSSAILPQWDIRLKREAFLRMAHHSTAIEGNPLEPNQVAGLVGGEDIAAREKDKREAVSYTHLRAHETRHDLVCRLLLE